MRKLWLRFTVAASFLVIVSILNVSAQRPPEITISAGEDFFDSVLDAALMGPDLPEFSISALGLMGDSVERSPFLTASYSSNWTYRVNRTGNACREVITLRREGGGGRTAVRFREGKILAPLSFTGQYNPPFIGCVQFGGVAETELNLEFDHETRRLTARARVVSVNIEGSGGVGGGVIARMVQSSIDRKVNPIELISLEKLSFVLPLRTESQLQMNARTIRAEVLPGRISINVVYEISKTR